MDYLKRNGNIKYPNAINKYANNSQFQESSKIPFPAKFNLDTSTA